MKQPKTIHPIRKTSTDNNSEMCGGRTHMQRRSQVCRIRRFRVKSLKSLDEQKKIVVSLAFILSSILLILIMLPTPPQLLVPARIWGRTLVPLYGYANAHMMPQNAVIALNVTTIHNIPNLNKYSNEALYKSSIILHLTGKFSRKGSRNIYRNLDFLTALCLLVNS